MVAEGRAFALANMAGKQYDTMLGFQSHVAVETTSGHYVALVVNVSPFDSLPSRCRPAAS